MPSISPLSGATLQVGQSNLIPPFGGLTTDPRCGGTAQCPNLLTTASFGIQEGSYCTSSLQANNQSGFQVVNLLSCSLTDDQIRVFSLGLSFCQEQEVDSFEIIKDINLFAQKLMFKVIYDKEHSISTSKNLSEEIWKDKTINEIRAINELMELWEESNPLDDPLKDFGPDLLLPTDSQS